MSFYRRGVLSAAANSTHYGTPTVTERAAATATTQTGTTTFSPATTVGTGTLAVLAATGLQNKTISSVSDSKGNTWNVDSTGGDGTRTTNFASAQISAAITNADTITITWSSVTSATHSYWLEECGVIASSSAFDKSATNNATSTPSLVTGVTATLSQSVELAWAIGITSISSSWTPGSGWTSATTATLNSNLSILEYKITASTTGLNGSGSWVSSGNVAGGIVTYKAAVIP